VLAKERLQLHPRYHPGRLNVQPVYSAAVLSDRVVTGAHRGAAVDVAAPAIVHAQVLDACLAMGRSTYRRAYREARGTRAERENKTRHHPTRPMRPSSRFRRPSVSRLRPGKVSLRWEESLARVEMRENGKLGEHEFLPFIPAMERSDSRSSLPFIPVMIAQRSPIILLVSLSERESTRESLSERVYLRERACPKEPA
jgi:hypothetical protein